MRAIIKFQKTGPARFISHLDLLRAMQRALRRAGLPVAFSQGFNPHMQISFASALQLGCRSLYEVMDVALLPGPVPDDFMGRLNAALPAGLAADGVRIVADTFPSPMAKCERAGYTITVKGDISSGIADFLAKDSVVVTKKGKSGPRRVDIRPMVFSLSARPPDGADMVLAHSGGGALSPDLLCGALGVDPVAITRTGLYAVCCGHAVGLFDIKEES